MAKKKSQAKKKTPVPALQTEEAVSREVETTEAQTEVKAGEETALVKATETEKETKKAEKTKEDKKQDKDNKNNKKNVKNAKNGKKLKEKGSLKRKTKETFAELKKVTWPSFADVCKKTGVVLVVVLIFAVIIFGIDTGLGALMRLLRPGS